MTQLFDYHYRQTIFLTGASGVLGSRILQELLLASDCHVICLMRDSNEAEARRRLAMALRYYDDDFDCDPYHARIDIVLGDISEALFGLDPHRYQLLAHSINTIIHAAANVNFTGLYASLSRVNVEGTEQVARLALVADAGLIHVSSYSIIGDAIFRPDFVFAEDDCDVGQDFKGFAYGRTKLEAELTLREMGSLRCIIVRPGDIYGDSLTGAYPLQAAGRPAFFYDIFKTAVETGICPFRDDFFDMTPVDFLARTIVLLSLDQTCFGMTFHLMNPRPRRFFELMNDLIEEGYRIRMLPFDEYVDAFRKGIKMANGRNYSSEFTAMTSLFARLFFQSTRAQFGTRCAEWLYAKAGLSFPKMDHTLLSRYIRFCQRSEYFIPPESQTLLRLPAQDQGCTVANSESKPFIRPAYTE